MTLNIGAPIGNLANHDRMAVFELMVRNGWGYNSTRKMEPLSHLDSFIETHACRTRLSDCDQKMSRSLRGTLRRMGDKIGIRIMPIDCLRADPALMHHATVIHEKHYDTRKNPRFYKPVSLSHHPEDGDIPLRVMCLFKSPSCIPNDLFAAVFFIDMNKAAYGYGYFYDPDYRDVDSPGLFANAVFNEYCRARGDRHIYTGTWSPDRCAGFRYKERLGAIETLWPDGVWRDPEIHGRHMDFDAMYLFYFSVLQILRPNIYDRRFALKP